MQKNSPQNLNEGLNEYRDRNWADIEDAEETFRATKRIAPPDRRQLAKNLGQLFRDVKRLEDGYSYAKLFAAAFDSEDIRESKLKKRKQHLVVGDETFNADQLVSRPTDYLSLLKPLVQSLMPTKSAIDQERLGLLRLLEGSSFLRDGGYRARFQQDQQEEIQHQLSRVVNRVRDAVDLDWMAAWCKTHPVAACGASGTATKLHAPHDDMGMGYSVSRGGLDLRHSVQNALAPSINLATIIIDRENCPNENLGLYHLNVESESGDRAALDEALLKTLGFEEKTKNSDELNERFRKAADFDADINLRSRLDLEIRYDEDLATWIPTLLWRPFDIDCGDFWQIAQIDCLNGRPALIHEEIMNEYYAYFFSRNRETRRAIYKVFDFDRDYDSNYFDLDYAKLSMFGLSGKVNFAPPDSAFYQVLLKQFDDINTSQPSDAEPSYQGSHLRLRFNQEVFGGYQWEDSMRGYVNAPADSLSALLLENLAYGDDGSRLDQLLVKDAQNKYQLLRDYADKSQAAYQAAIDKNLG